MNIVEINTLNFGSTGGIMLGVAEALRRMNHRVMVCYPATKSNYRRHGQVEGAYLVCGQVERNIALNLSKLTGRDDLLFRRTTRRLVRAIDRFGADVIHLHNLHGWYINLPVLFDYIKKKNIRVVWTLHDCWAMTGHCPHFDMTGCDKWKTGCHDCPIYRDYPECRTDQSRRMHQVKQRACSGVSDMTVVAPSRWLASVAAQSYLRDYPLQIIPNGIDLQVFTRTDSPFRLRHDCEGKTILLGVAMAWTERKGLDVFIRLARELDDRYRIVLVGTDEAVDRQLPANVISIHQTHDPQELSGIYSAADLLINPTREETFSLVNVEAMACGTPVLSFQTGGSPETIDDTCGAIVERDDYAALKKELVRIIEEKPFPAEACRARAEHFAREKMVSRYVRLLTAAQSTEEQ